MTSKTKVSRRKCLMCEKLLLSTETTFCGDSLQKKTSCAVMSRNKFFASFKWEKEQKYRESPKGSGVWVKSV